MAAGDAQKVWFPEMIERLRAQWHHGISCDTLLELRDELDAQLQWIRSERGIHSPVLKCPCCGHVGEGGDPHVSVRAVILSLGRFGITSAAQTSAFEKRWAAHRKQHGLDLYGKKKREAGLSNHGLRASTRAVAGGLWTVLGSHRSRHTAGSEVRPRLTCDFEDRTLTITRGALTCIPRGPSIAKVSACRH
jgi:hypothetical protein